jgi:predicted branched-subunit amino acid permease
VSPSPATDDRYASTAEAFFGGLRAAASSVLTYTLFVTYIGVGALAHDVHFSLPWAVISTVLVWAAPAQIIFLTTIAAGGSGLQAALAVTLSAIRLMPMVVALLPMMRDRDTRAWHLVLPTHFTAVTMWVESYRLLPQVPRRRRVAFVHGLGCGLVAVSSVATAIGYGLAANLPPLLGAAVLFLTPMSFLVSTARSSRSRIDRIALGLGLVSTPLIALAKTGVDVLLGGVLAGSLAYGWDRWRRRA